MVELGIPANWFVAGTTVDATFRRLAPELATMWKVRVERPNANTLVIRHRTAPGWWWVKATQTATVIGTDVDGGARFTATGQTSSSALIAIHRAFGLPDPDIAHDPA